MTTYMATGGWITKPRKLTIDSSEFVWWRHGWAPALPPPDPSTRVERPPVDTGWVYATSYHGGLFRSSARGYDVLKVRIRTVNGVDTCEIVRLDP